MNRPFADGMTMWKGSETYELYCKRSSWIRRIVFINAPTS